ncbi:MAG: leucyl/phenylalanyl-tRNA--protein transferase [Ferruginibacter sp.]|nr:leucyl/phenylalanyl-tRNA--protein transferase [Ferruginibacter sp.]
MIMFILSDKLYFPPIHQADEDGLLAIGGDLGTERLLLAYRSGIFPWYSDDEPILWWSPNPRFVLYPTELKISKSMKTVLNKQLFTFTINKDFNAVMQHCKNVNRPGQDGTWISNEVITAYTNLHQQGYAISAETWQNNTLVGGLYGIKLGNIFFGESMFSLVPNASKFAFIKLVQLLQQQGVVLIDCQIYTEHLESLGARMIEREEFVKIISNSN